jgi:PEP-CTERM motif
MKRLLLSTAMALGMASAAYAGPVNYTGYSTPDNAGFNSVTTTANGASDTPYSYYTGPVVFTVSTGNITAYCVDLNHYLQGSGLYNTGILDHNGEGQVISEFDSNRIGHIAAIGAAALQFGDLGHQLIAAAAQAAIWDIAYSSDNVTSVANTGNLQTDITTLLGDHFSNNGYARALLVPDGVDNQEMVTGFGSAVPEPSTWAMGLAGFAFLGAMGWKRKRQSRYAIEA